MKEENCKKLSCGNFAEAIMPVVKLGLEIQRLEEKSKQELEERGAVTQAQNLLIEDAIRQVNLRTAEEHSDHLARRRVLVAQMLAAEEGISQFVTPGTPEFTMAQFVAGSQRMRRAVEAIVKADRCWRSVAKEDEDFGRSVRKASREKARLSAAIQPPPSEILPRFSRRRAKLKEKQKLESNRLGLNRSNR